MYLGKRKPDTSVCRYAPPAKIAKQLGNLMLSDAPEATEMDGVEGETFTYLDRQTWLDQLNAVDVDDRFLKIPRSIVSADEKQVQRDRAKEWALIPYRADTMSD